jgi:hypothetical protein
VEKGSIEDIFLGLEMNTGLNDEEIGQNNERDDRVNIVRLDNLCTSNNNNSFQVANATAAQQMGAVAVTSSISDYEGNTDQAGSESSGILDMTRDNVEQEHGRRRLVPQGNETETQQVVIINLSTNERPGWRMGSMDLTPVKALKGWPTVPLKEDERGYLPGLTADDIRINEKRAQGVGVNMSLKLILDIRTEHVIRSREDEVQNEHDDSAAS